jgi:O-acetyl-ADP-ribose deacetylase (regulator of RNase III)
MLWTVTERPTGSSRQSEPLPNDPVPDSLIRIEDIVADLQLLRQRGLLRIRHAELSALRLAAGRALPVPPGENGPRAIEALLRAATANLGDGPLGVAAARTFGLNRGARDSAAQDRRRQAAQAYRVSIERFRKHHERVVIEQVAEEILGLCLSAGAGPRTPAGTVDMAKEIRLECRTGDTSFPVVVHVEPVELVRDIDVIVAPTNVYLELPQPYKASVSAALRRAAARRGPDGAIESDPVAAELQAWMTANGRRGLPVSAGTVAATSAGDLARQGIRRIYHAAVASPRPGTNEYDVEPTSISQAVHAAFATARAERDQFRPRLTSLGFPLLGAGRGGLAPAVSFTWIWAAVEREMRTDSSWLIHFITYQRAVADAIVEGITGSHRRVESVSRDLPCI